MMHIALEMCWNVGELYLTTQVDEESCNVSLILNKLQIINDLTAKTPKDAGCLGHVGRIPINFQIEIALDT